MRNAKTKKEPKTKKLGLGDKMKKIKEKAIKEGRLKTIDDEKELEKYVNERRFG